MTLCSSGNNELLTNATLIKQFFDFIEIESGIKLDISPLEVAELLSEVNTLLVDIAKLVSVMTLLS